MNFNADQLNGLYQYALSLTGHRDDALDLLQTSLEKSLRSQNVELKNLGYVRTIIRHQFIDQCRRQKLVAFEPIADSNLALFSTEPLDKAIIDENHISKLMVSLNTGEREALYLWAVLDYTASEIAEETGDSRGTILSRLFRVKKKLQSLDSALLERQNDAPTVEGGS